MMTTPSLQSDYADFEWLIRYGKDSSSFGQSNSGGSSESSSSGSSFGQSDGSSSPTPKSSEPSEPKNETGEGVFDRMEEEHNEEPSQAETTATSGGQGDAPFMMIGNYKYELVQKGKNAGKYIFAFTLPNGQKVCREYSKDRETANILASKGEEFDPYKETTGQRRITDDDYNSMRSEWAQRAQAQSTEPKLPKGYENMPPLAQEWYRTGKILNGQYSIANGGPARDVASIAAKMAKLPRDSYEWRQANNELVARMANGVNDPDGSVDLQPFRDALIPYKTADALGLAKRYRFRPEGATKDDAYYDLVKNSVALQEALVEYGNNFDKTFVHTYTSQIPKETYLVDDLREKVMEAGRQALSGNTSLTGPVTDTINDAIVGTQEEPSETETGVEEEQSEQSSEETVAPVGARDIDAIKAVLQQSTIEPDRMASLFKGNQLSQKTVSRQIKERGLTPEKSTYTAQDLLKTIWVRGNLSESTSNKMLALAQAKRTGDIASAREVLHDIWETRSNTFARAFVHHGDSDLLSTTFGIDIQKYGIRGFSQADRAYMTELASMSSGDLERLAATEMSKASEIRRLFDNGVLANPWEMTEETEAEPDETDAGAFEALRRDGDAIDWVDVLGTSQPNTMKVGDIKVYPKDYQYKRGTNKEGAREEWLDGKEFLPGLAETIDVWQDPETGEYVCINGHHRLALAKKSNYGGDVPVWIHDVRTKEEARVLGALLNIQQRKGTSIDAATVLREMDLPEEVRDALGFNEAGALGAEAQGISQLDDSIYNLVQKGRLSPKVGAIIGTAINRRIVDNASMKQQACLNFMRKHGYDENTPADKLRAIALSFRNAEFSEDGEQLSFFSMLSSDAYNEAFADLQYEVMTKLKNARSLGALIKQRGSEAQNEGLVTGTNKEESAKLQSKAKKAIRFFDHSLMYRTDFHDQYFSEQVKKFLDAQTSAGESGSEEAKLQRDAVVDETVRDLLEWGGNDSAFDEWVAARSAERVGQETAESTSEPERGESGQTADEGGEETVSNGGVQSPEGDGLLTEGDREDDGNQLPEGGESGNQVQSVEEGGPETDEAALQSLGTTDEQQEDNEPRRRRVPMPSRDNDSEKKGNGEASFSWNDDYLNVEAKDDSTDTDQPSPQEAGEQIANTLSDVMNEAGLDTSDVEAAAELAKTGSDAEAKESRTTKTDDLELARAWNYLDKSKVGGKTNAERLAEAIVDKNKYLPQKAANTIRQLAKWYPEIRDVINKYEDVTNGIQRDGIHSLNDYPEYKEAYETLRLVIAKGLLGRDIPVNGEMLLKIKKEKYEEDPEFVADPEKELKWEHNLRTFMLKNTDTLRQLHIKLNEEGRLQSVHPFYRADALRRKYHIGDVLYKSLSGDYMYCWSNGLKKGMEEKSKELSRDYRFVRNRVEDELSDWVNKFEFGKQGRLYADDFINLTNGAITVLTGLRLDMAAAERSRKPSVKAKMKEYKTQEELLLGYLRSLADVYVQRPLPAYYDDGYGGLPDKEREYEKRMEQLDDAKKYLEWFETDPEGTASHFGSNLRLAYQTAKSNVENLTRETERLRSFIDNAYAEIASRNKDQQIDEDSVLETADNGSLPTAQLAEEQQSDEALSDSLAQESDIEPETEQSDSLAQEQDIETQPGTLTEEQPTMETEPDTVEQADTMPAQDEQRAQEIAQTPETGHGTEPPVTENPVEPTATEAPQIEQQPAAPSDEQAAMKVGKPAENVQPTPKPKKEPKKTDEEYAQEIAQEPGTNQEPTVDETDDNLERMRKAKPYRDSIQKLREEIARLNFERIDAIDAGDDDKAQEIKAHIKEKAKAIEEKELELDEVLGGKPEWIKPDIPDDWEPEALKNMTPEEKKRLKEHEKRMKEWKKNRAQEKPTTTKDYLVKAMRDYLINDSAIKQNILREDSDLQEMYDRLGKIRDDAKFEKAWDDMIENLWYVNEDGYGLDEDLYNIVCELYHAGAEISQIRNAFNEAWNDPKSGLNNTKKRRKMYDYFRDQFDSAVDQLEEEVDADDDIRSGGSYGLFLSDVDPDTQAERMYGMIQNEGNDHRGVIQTIGNPSVNQATRDYLFRFVHNRFDDDGNFLELAERAYEMANNGEWFRGFGYLDDLVRTKSDLSYQEENLEWLKGLPVDERFSEEDKQREIERRTQKIEELRQQVADLESKVAAHGLEIPGKPKVDDIHETEESNTKPESPEQPQEPQPNEGELLAQDEEAPTNDQMEPTNEEPVQNDEQSLMDVGTEEPKGEEEAASNVDTQKDNAETSSNILKDGLSWTDSKADLSTEEGRAQMLEDAARKKEELLAKMKGQKPEKTDEAQAQELAQEPEEQKPDRRAEWDDLNTKIANLEGKYLRARSDKSREEHLNKLKELRTQREKLHKELDDVEMPEDGILSALEGKVTQKDKSTKHEKQPRKKYEKDTKTREAKEKRNNYYRAAYGEEYPDSEPVGKSLKAEPQVTEQVPEPEQTTVTPEPKTDEDQFSELAKEPQAEKPIATKPEAPSDEQSLMDIPAPEPKPTPKPEPKQETKPEAKPAPVPEQPKPEQPKPAVAQKPPAEPASKPVATPPSTSTTKDDEAQFDSLARQETGSEPKKPNGRQKPKFPVRSQRAGHWSDEGRRSNLSVKGLEEDWEPGAQSIFDRVPGENEYDEDEEVPEEGVEEISKDDMRMIISDMRQATGNNLNDWGKPGGMFPPSKTGEPNKNLKDAVQSHKTLEAYILSSDKHSTPTKMMRLFVLNRLKPSFYTSRSGGAGVRSLVELGTDFDAITSNIRVESIRKNATALRDSIAAYSNKAYEYALMREAYTPLGKVQTTAAKTGVDERPEADVGLGNIAIEQYRRYLENVKAVADSKSETGPGTFLEELETKYKTTPSVMQRIKRIPNKGRKELEAGYSDWLRSKGYEGKMVRAELLNEYVSSASPDGEGTVLDNLEKKYGVEPLPLEQRINALPKEGREEFKERYFDYVTEKEIEASEELGGALARNKIKGIRGAKSSERKQAAIDEALAREEELNPETVNWSEPNFFPTGDDDDDADDYPLFTKNGDVKPFGASWNPNEHSEKGRFTSAEINDDEAESVVGVNMNNESKTSTQTYFEDLKKDFDRMFPGLDDVNIDGDTKLPWDGTRPEDILTEEQQTAIKKKVDSQRECYERLTDPERGFPEILQIAAMYQTLQNTPVKIGTDGRTLDQFVKYPAFTETGSSNKEVKRSGKVRGEELAITPEAVFTKPWLFVYPENRAAAEEMAKDVIAQRKADKLSYAKSDEDMLFDICRGYDRGQCTTDCPTLFI